VDLSYKISQILKAKGVSKKFFAQWLLELKPVLKSTGETPSISSIYSYLNGSREIKAELLPYIAEVLDITIGELFEEDEKVRIKILENILKSPTHKEKKLLERYFKLEEHHYNKKLQTDTNYSLYSYIFAMLPYASEKFLYTLIDVLESFKDSTKRAEDEIKKKHSY